MCSWQKLLAESLTASVHSSVNVISVAKEPSIFEILTQKIDDYFYNLKSHNMKDLKLARDINRQKGMLFEDLVFYLINNKCILSKFNITSVWKFADIPNDLRAQLQLINRKGKITRKDMGIDLVAKCENGDSNTSWIAIQCKYITKPVRPRKISTKNGAYQAPWIVPHKGLSTFYALCAKTGPMDEKDSRKVSTWSRRVVITNCNGVNHQGQKEDHVDITIARGTLANISRDQWEALCDYKSHTLTEEKINNDNPKEQMMISRNKFLDRLTQQTSEVTK